MMYNLLWKFQPQVKRMRPVYVAIDRAFSLIEKIEELRTEKLTSLNPIVLLDILERVVKVCIDKLLDIEKELGDKDILNQELENKENQVRNIARELNEIHAYLRYIYATKLDRNPSGMVLPWELLINKYYPDVKTIIRPQWRWNYKYFDIMKELKRVLGPIDPKVKNVLATYDKFPVFSFPGLERDNILLHVILAHEIGHFIDDVFHFSDDSKVKSAIKWDIKRITQLIELEIKISEVHKTSSSPALTQQQLEFFRLMVQAISSQAVMTIKAHTAQWLKELTADIIALRIVGPAYFFALSQAALSQLSIHQIAGRYPPPIQRLTKVFDECKNGNPSHYEFFKPTENDEEEIRKIKETIIAYFKDIEDIKKKDFNEENELSQDLSRRRDRLLADLIDAAITDSIQVIKKLIYEKIPNNKAYRLEESIFDQIAYLRDQITPNQKILLQGNNVEFEPFSMESILNAGWIFWLTHKREDKPKEGAEEELQEEIKINEAKERYYNPLKEVSSLVLRAIELSNFHKQFIAEKKKRWNEINKKIN